MGIRNSIYDSMACIYSWFMIANFLWYIALVNGANTPTYNSCTWYLEQWGNILIPITLGLLPLFMGAWRCLLGTPCLMHRASCVHDTLMGQICEGLLQTLELLIWDHQKSTVPRLVEGTIYRKPWFPHENIGGSWKFSRKPIQWCRFYDLWVMRKWRGFSRNNNI